MASVDERSDHREPPRHCGRRRSPVPLRLFKNHEEMGMPPLKPCAIALVLSIALVSAVAQAQGRSAPASGK